jgi:hypothetical protein
MQCRNLSAQTEADEADISGGNRRTMRGAGHQVIVVLRPVIPGCACSTRGARNDGQSIG